MSDSNSLQIQIRQCSILEKLKALVGANYFLIVEVNQSSDPDAQESKVNSLTKRTDIAFNSTSDPAFVNHTLNFDPFDNKGKRTTVLSFELFMAPSSVHDENSPSDAQIQFLKDNSMLVGSFQMTLFEEHIAQLSRLEKIPLTLKLVDRLPVKMGGESKKKEIAMLEAEVSLLVNSL